MALVGFLMYTFRSTPTRQFHVRLSGFRPAFIQPSTTATQWDGEINVSFAELLPSLPNNVEESLPFCYFHTSSIYNFSRDLVLLRVFHHSPHSDSVLLQAMVMIWNSQDFFSYLRRYVMCAHTNLHNVSTFIHSQQKPIVGIHSLAEVGFWRRRECVEWKTSVHQLTFMWVWDMWKRVHITNEWRRWVNSTKLVAFIMSQNKSLLKKQKKNAFKPNERV